MTDYPPPPPPPPSSGDGWGTPAGGPAPFDVASAFGYAVTKFRTHWAVLVVLTLIVVGVSLAAQVVGRVIANTLVDTSQTAWFSAGVLAAWLAASLSFVVQALAQAGLIKASLSITVDQDVTVASAYADIDWAKVLLTALIQGVVYFIGFVLFVIPGLIWLVLTWYSLYFVIDRGMEPIEAIKASISLVTSNLGMVVLLALACVAALIAGVCACGVGLLVAAPIVTVATAYSYRSFNAEPVVA